MISGKVSTVNEYVISTCFAEIMASVLAVACKQFSGTFTFPISGAVKRFLIKASIK